MKTRIILVFLLLSAIAFAQDIQPPQIDVARMRAEVGDLYLQVSAYREWVVTLQNRITELQKENAELKEKLAPKEK